MEAMTTRVKQLERIVETQQRNIIQLAEAIKVNRDGIQGILKYLQAKEGPDDEGTQEG